MFSRSAVFSKVKACRAIRDCYHKLGILAEKERMVRVIVTGGAGFIGSALIRYLLGNRLAQVINLDALTYAANPQAVAEYADDPSYRFVRMDIGDGEAVASLLAETQPDGIIHLAAESHVDRSIDGPMAFLQTNILGTGVLLEAARSYWAGLSSERQAGFRFHHVSTDEVFGDLAAGEPAFTETTAYHPHSPYAASKAGSDHLVRAWGRTYGLPIVVTNCSNNFGPWQFPEKMIPLMILRMLQGQSLPVYGDGSNRRDWLYVEDHARALWTVFQRGRLGETYAIGGAGAERSNLEVVHQLCDLMDRKVPLSGRSYRASISFVTDRPGHDFRYAIDSGKIERELGWRAEHSFEDALGQTVDWYLAHRDWMDTLDPARRAGERLGVRS